jgi:DNA-binding response OmpR family regulator
VAQPVIVIAEDDRSVRELMRETLELEGYQVVTTSTGTGALDLARRVAPALLVLDLHIERRVAGILVLTDLRRDPALRALPVILATADWAWLEDNAARLHQLGCAVLRKPFTLGELLTQVSATMRPDMDTA